MKRFRSTFALCLLLVAAHASAQSAAVKPGRLTAPPAIDGRLDDEVWQHAARVTTFHQVQPGDNTSPSQPTELLIGYDKRALYLAFRARDASPHVRATVARRDAIAEDDVVGVYLDTYQDRRRAYYLFFNPYGIQADGIYTEGRSDPDLTVDLVMDSKGTVDATGYTVEVSIPFASLRYQAGDAALWGLHVQRFIRRDRNEQISWMPLSRSRSSLLDQAGQLGPFIDAGEGRPLEITPTGVLTQSTTRTSEGRGDPEPGVTVNFGITPTMNASFAANPDFAQVEADQLVLTVNQRFPIFYDEKRPFFLEGIDAFQTPINLLHTRTIVDPDYAVKMTGKHGRTTAGALVAADGALKSALRVKHDIGHDSIVGGLATSFEEGGVFGRVVSADARIRLTDQTVFTSQLAGTFADAAFRDPVTGGTRQRQGSGLGYFAKFERRSRRSLTAVTWQGLSPDYRADLGFNRRVNNNSVSVQTTYNSEPKPDASLLSFLLTNITFVQWDWQGRADFIYVYPQAQLNFRRQTYVRALAFRDYERIFEEEFGATRGAGRTGAFIGDSERSTSWEGVVLQAGTAPSEAISVGAAVSRSWDVFDYDFGAGARYPRVSPAALIDPRAPLDPGPATSTSVGGDITWRPIDALRTSLNVSHNTLVRNDNGRTAYAAALISARTTYQFTRFAFIRLRTDWDSAAAVLRGQYLLGWTPNPGTAVYVGYNDAADTTPRYQRSQRTVFVKVSYLYRTIL